MMDAFKYTMIFTAKDLDERNKYIQELHNLGYVKYGDSFADSQLKVKSYAPSAEYNTFLPTNDVSEFGSYQLSDFDTALAIASIHKGEAFHAGEWVKVVNRGGHNSSHKWYKGSVFKAQPYGNNAPEFFKIQDIDNNKDKIGAFEVEGIQVVLKLNNSAFRAVYAQKATPKELIELFKQKNKAEVKEKTKNVIGYRLLKDAPGVTKGTELRETHNAVDGKRWRWFDSHGFYRGWNEAIIKESPEWFEPLYEEDQVVIFTLGSNGVEIYVDSNKKILVRGNTIQIADLKKISYWFKNPDGWSLAEWKISYEPNHRFIRVGCQSENNLFSLNDIDQVINTYEKLNP